MMIKAELNHSLPIKNGNVYPNGTASIKDTSSNHQSHPVSSNMSNNGVVRRIELAPLIKEFREFLGEKVWCEYYSTLSRFILGKLSTTEFRFFIQRNFTKYELEKLKSSKQIQENANYEQKFIKYHNKFLIAQLANAFKDAPDPSSVSNEGFGFLNTLSDGTHRKNLKLINSSTNSNDEREILKRTVMGLTIKERKRIKHISKNTDPRICFAIDKFSLGMVAQDRYELLPKVPAILQHEASTGQSSMKLNSASDTTLSKNSKNDKNINLLPKDKKEEIPVTPTTPGSSLNNIATYSNEILEGIQAQLASELYELPANSHLHTRITGIMRESGLLGTLDNNTVKMIQMGLESYLKNIIEAAIDTVACHCINKNNYEEFEVAPDIETLNSYEEEDNIYDAKPEDNKNIVLSAEDIYETFKITPHLIEPNGILDKISLVHLRDDDVYKFDLENENEIADLLPVNDVKDMSFCEGNKKRKLDDGCVSIFKKFTGTGVYRALAKSEAKQVSGLQKVKKTESQKNIDSNSVSMSNATGSKEELLWLIQDLLA